MTIFLENAYSLLWLAWPRDDREVEFEKYNQLYVKLANTGPIR
jgi:hypothetical protein